MAGETCTRPGDVGLQGGSSVRRPPGLRACSSLPEPQLLGSERGTFRKAGSQATPFVHTCSPEAVTHLFPCLHSRLRLLVRARAGVLGAPHGLECAFPQVRRHAPGECGRRPAVQAGAPGPAAPSAGALLPLGRHGGRDWGAQLDCPRPPASGREESDVPGVHRVLPVRALPPVPGPSPGPRGGLWVGLT